MSEQSQPWWQSRSGECLRFEPILDNELTCLHCLRWRGHHPHHEVIRLHGIVAAQLRQAVADLDHTEQREAEARRAELEGLKAVIDKNFDAQDYSDDLQHIVHAIDARLTALTASQGASQ